MILSARAGMKALFGELPKVCKSLQCDESGQLKEVASAKVALKEENGHGR